MYFVEKNLTRFYNLGYTYFLDSKEIRQVQSKLKKGDYSIYKVYPDSEKNIIYQGSIPEVLLYEIRCSFEVRHQDILGCMYSLNIASDLFGDVLVIDYHYFVYILPILRNYFESNFTRIKNGRVELIEIPIDTFSSYERSYEKLEYIVSSNRIDTILSSILHTGRSNVVDFIKKKEVLLNYDYLKDLDYKLKEGDTFSIRKIGKFKYNGVIKNTKSNHLIIEVLKYK